MKELLICSAVLLAVVTIFAQTPENTQDRRACAYARKKGTLEVWQDYLRQFPKGDCAFEAKSESKQLRLKKLHWSRKSPRKMSYDDAVKYCSNLKEGKHSDWRLPNIDELRTLVKNHQSTRSDGACPVSEEDGRLDGRDCTQACWTEEGMASDNDWLWSSSIQPGYPKNVWSVFYPSEDVTTAYRDFDGSVKCVRY